MKLKSKPFLPWVLRLAPGLAANRIERNKIVYYIYCHEGPREAELNI